MSILDNLKWACVDDLREKMDEWAPEDGDVENLLHNIARSYVPQYHKELESVIDELLILLSKKPQEWPPVGEVTPIKVFLHNIQEELVSHLRIVYSDVTESRRDR